MAATNHPPSIHRWRDYLLRHSSNQRVRAASPYTNASAAAAGLGCTPTGAYRIGQAAACLSATADATNSGGSTDGTTVSGEPKQPLVNNSNTLTLSMQPPQHEKATLEEGRRRIPPGE
eukprot:GHVU01047710.1.p3 GENE.GHVU01047710.1~~GHVU01047710.1.p3  ORF type:complete len:118 (-),score=14.53 GHVU01047710.1:236-589(-)